MTQNPKVTLADALTALDKTLDTLFAVDDSLKPHISVINPRLKRFFTHRSEWVAPYDPEKRSASPAVPAFEPTWLNHNYEGSAAGAIAFSKVEKGETLTVNVPIDFIVHPDDWIAEDKLTRVTKDEWMAQRREATQVWRDHDLEVAAQRLRQAGWSVEKPEPVEAPAETEATEAPAEVPAQ